MRKLALMSMTAMLVFSSQTAAVADWLTGPVKVMRPDGSVFMIEAPSRWWKDYRRVSGLSPSGPALCDSCRSPREAARVLDRVSTAGGTRLRAGARYLILPAALDLQWPYAWHFYPSTDRTPAYLVQRGAVGAAAGRPLRWDQWMPATRRMEKMIVEGPADASAIGTVDEPGPIPPTWWRWVVLALAIAFAVGASGYVRRRRAQR